MIVNKQGLGDDSSGDNFGTLDQQITSSVISGLGFALGGLLAVWVLGFSKKAKELWR